MDWNITQNFSSNIVFGILLFAMIIYWINLSLFRGTKNLLQVGKLSAIIANILLFFILCSRWIIAGYFPLSNLYESLLFLTWTLLTIYLYLEFKTKSKLLGAILLPIALLINGFANLTLSFTVKLVNDARKYDDVKLCDINNWFIIMYFIPCSFKITRC
jgi:ABC-type transport system involved in cytochrome c biogenesis permease subunit